GPVWSLCGHLQTITACESLLHCHIDLPNWPQNSTSETIQHPTLNSLSFRAGTADSFNVISAIFRRIRLPELKEVCFMVDYRSQANCMLLLAALQSISQSLPRSLEQLTLHGVEAPILYLRSILNRFPTIKSVGLYDCDFGVDTEDVRTAITNRARFGWEYPEVAVARTCCFDLDNASAARDREILSTFY
ncbi:hypothetical protein BT96DRAFT_951971, partial [Gymnopus androsaceus JB14]